MKILVSGKNSQLGEEFFKITKNSKNIYEFTDSKTLNFNNVQSVEDVIKSFKPDIFINFSAYTKVDLAESNIEDARVINSLTPGFIAKLLSEYDSFFIHISTDYVFGIDKSGPYKHSDQTSPINNYGKTKLEGEEAIAKNKVRHLIIRTSGIFSSYGSNFVKTVAKKMINNQDIKIVDDQLTNFSFARDLASFVFKIIEGEKYNSITQKHSNIIHFTNEGNATWFEMAKFIRDNLSTVPESKLEPTTIDNWEAAAKRPKDSRLTIDYDLLNALGIKINPWQDNVLKVLRELNY